MEQINGELIGACINLIGLIVLWVKDYLNSKRISNLEKINVSLNEINKTNVNKLDEICREIGIGHEINARNVIAKKYEIDEIRKQVIILENSNKLNIEKTEALFVQSIYNNFKDVYSMVLSNSEVTKVLSKELSLDNSQISEIYFSSFLINNSFQCFLLNEKGLLPSNLWLIIQTDMKELFSWQFILNRWEVIFNLYPKEFQAFIGTLKN
jgi:hypothetical protein